MYKNELLSIQQKRSLSKEEKEKIKEYQRKR